jgi:hypothetical protein
MSTETLKSDYMLLFRSTQWDKDLSAEEIREVMSRWRAWFERLTQEGKVKSGHPLADQGKVVSGARGVSVADGPFAESKEAIAGYFLANVENLGEALDIAKGCPALDYGMTVEVRPVLESCQPSQRANEQLTHATA